MATACGWSCYHPHLSSLHQVREHDNHPTLPVVHHLPEVPGSGLHGALGDDEGSLLLVALEEGKGNGSTLHCARRSSWKLCRYYAGDETACRACKHTQAEHNVVKRMLHC